MPQHEDASLRSPRPPLPRSVWVLSWVSCFADISGEMITPLLPLFLVAVLGASKAHVGLIEGSALLMVALMSAYAGFRSDRTGRRVPWIRVGYALPVLGKAAIAASIVWPMVMGGRLLDRLGKGLRGAPRDALIASAVHAEQRGRAFGVHRALDTAGALSGVLISAALLWWLSDPSDGVSDVGASGDGPGTPAWVYRTIFAIGAALGLIAFALTLLAREADAPPPQPAGLVAPVSADGNPAPRPGLFALPARYWLVLGVLVLFSLASSADAFLLLRAHDLGFASWNVALLYAAYNAAYAGFSYPAGVWSDRLGGVRGRWKVIAVGWAIYVGVYLGFASLSPGSAWALWPLMAIYGLSTALTEGVGKALIADYAPRERRGTALGLFACITGITTLGASLIAGLVWDRYGPAPAFLIGAGFALAALAALGVLRAVVGVQGAASRA